MAKKADPKISDEERLAEHARKTQEAEEANRKRKDQGSSKGVEGRDEYTAAMMEIVTQIQETINALLWKMLTTPFKAAKNAISNSDDKPSKNEDSTPSLYDEPKQKQKAAPDGPYSRPDPIPATPATASADEAAPPAYDDTQGTTPVAGPAEPEEDPAPPAYDDIQETTPNIAGPAEPEEDPAPPAYEDEEDPAPPSKDAGFDSNTTNFDAAPSPTPDGMGPVSTNTATSPQAATQSKSAAFDASPAAASPSQSQANTPAEENDNRSSMQNN